MKTPRFLLPIRYRDFFRALDSCEKEVELITQEGFHLNLKSKLAQYVAMTNVFQNAQVEECEIVTHSTQDTIRMLTCLLVMKKP